MAGTEQCDDTPLTLAQVTDGTPPLTPTRALALVRASALALDRFHARQPVHGALSPQAFVVGADDLVSVEEPVTSHQLTTDTAAYWSPQRQAGQPPRASDDLYALGLIAEQLLWSADMHVRAAGANADAVLTAAEALVRALTSWSPAERPASGAEVAQALDRVMSVAEALPGTSQAGKEAAPRIPMEAPWAAAERVSQARRAHQLAQTTPPRPARPVRQAQVRAPLGKGHYPDMPLPLPWVAAIVVVLCSVYLLPIYFMLFPAG